MTRTHDPIAHLRRCIRAERQAAFQVIALTGWGSGEKEDAAYEAAKRETNAAIRALAAAAPARTRQETQ